jgi:hypothetical protein
VDISDLIRTLERLEEQKLLSPREFLSSQGLDKASETLSLYEKGLEYGLPQDALKSLFSKPESAPVSIPDPEPETSLDVDGVLRDLSEVVVGEASEPKSWFLNDSEIHLFLSSLAHDNNISISGLQICCLADVEPTKGVLRKITSELDLVGFKSRLENDPTRPIRTRTRFYTVDLSQLDGLSDLWVFLIERREAKSWKVPIALYDYLDGTESGFRFVNDALGEDVSIVLQSYNFDRFRNTLRPLYKKVFGESLDTLVKNDGMNKFLLSTAMMMAFPMTPLKRLVAERVDDPERRSEIKALVRKTLQQIKVSQSIFDDDWTSLDSTISGFVYLIACMIIDYNISGD